MSFSVFSGFLYNPFLSLFRGIFPSLFSYRRVFLLFLVPFCSFHTFFTFYCISLPASAYHCFFYLLFHCTASSLNYSHFPECLFYLFHIFSFHTVFIFLYISLSASVYNFFISSHHSFPPSLVSFPRVFLPSPLRYGLVFISFFIFTIAFYCMSLDIVNILTLILVLLLSSLLLSLPFGRAMTGQELAACFPPPFLASSLPPFFHGRLRKRMSGGRNGNMSPSDLLSSLPPSLPTLLSLALLSPQVTYSYSTTRGMK